MSAYLTEMFGLGGRLAVVTGGSSGIGRAMAVAVARAGAKVVLVARRADLLDEAAREISGHGGEVAVESADLGDRERVHALIGTVLERHGEPDVLVNAAGVNIRPPLGELTEDEWDYTLAANLTAPFLLGQAFGPRMAARGWGRIINVVSQQAFRAYGNSGGYGVSKAGLVALTRSQAEAWSRSGVCCNAIAPGVVHTPMTEGVLADPAKARAHEARTMTGRNGVPDDFAGMAVYLAGNSCSSVTGQTLFVDGGYSAT